MNLFFVNFTSENFLESAGRKDSQAELFPRVPVSKNYNRKTYCTSTSVRLFMTVHNRAKTQKRIHIVNIDTQ